MNEKDSITLLLGTDNSLVHIAYDICKEYHADQTDANGRVYYEHPIRIATQCDSDEEKIVALLHDIIEDTSLTASDLENYGIPKVCIEAILLLSRNKEEPYGDYIRTIKNSGNIIALKIKILDIKDNSNLTRIKDISERDISRTERYLRALKILLNYSE